MIYVVIDTCVFVKVWTQSAAGCELSQLSALGELIDQGAVKLLLPEVILLELQKEWRRFPSKVKEDAAIRKQHIVEALKAPKQGKYWNEADAMAENILDSFDKSEAEFIQACQDRHRSLDEFLQSGRTINISLTAEIMVNAKKLMISGAMPKTDRADQDAFIIQSVIQELKACDKTNDLLYFCTQNHKDFTVTVDSDPALRIGVQEQLPKSMFHSNLKSLVDAARLHVVPTELDPEKVQDAEGRDDDIGGSYENDIGIVVPEELGGNGQKFRTTGVKLDSVFKSGLKHQIEEALALRKAYEELVWPYAEQAKTITAALDAVTASAIKSQIMHAREIEKAQESLVQPIIESTRALTENATRAYEEVIESQMGQIAEGTKQIRDSLRMNTNFAVDQDM